MSARMRSISLALAANQRASGLVPPSHAPTLRACGEEDFHEHLIMQGGGQHERGEAGLAGHIVVQALVLKPVGEGFGHIRRQLDVGSMPSLSRRQKFALSPLAHAPKNSMASSASSAFVSFPLPLQDGGRSGLIMATSVVWARSPKKKSPPMAMTHEKNHRPAGQSVFTDSEYSWVAGPKNANFSSTSRCKLRKKCRN